MKYERITGQEWSENIDLTQELGYSYIYKRLHELENKIEQGTLIGKEVVELFAAGEENFRRKAKFYYERCKSYGIENFYDAELEYEED